MPLTTAQKLVTVLFGGVQPSLISELVAYWKLEEASGSRADSAGANTLTDPGTTPSGTGKVGNGAALASASSQYLVCPIPSTLHFGGSFTGFGWVNHTALAAAQGFLGIWDANKQEWVLWYDGTHWALAISTTGANAISKQYTLFAEPTGSFQFLTFQLDLANAQVIFRMNNGQSQKVALAGTPFVSTGQLRMGSVAATSYMNGVLDEWGLAAGLWTPAKLSIVWNYGAGMTAPLLVDRHPLVIFDGDSTVAGYGIATQAGAMPQQFEASCGTAYHVVNMGVSGLRVTTMLTSDAALIDSQLSTTLFAKNIVVFQAGTNDLYDTITDVYTNIVAWCQARRAAGWKVVVSTILPRKDAGLRADFEADRQTVNTSIRTNWPTFADALSDLGDDAAIGQADSPDDTTYYQADKLHPKQAGAAVIAALHKVAVGTL